LGFKTRRVPLLAPVLLVGVLLFAITQLQAVAAHVRKVDATAATQELEPFVSFLTASLAAASAHRTRPRA
jgi:hypothetical protein